MFVSCTSNRSSNLFQSVLSHAGLFSFIATSTLALALRRFLKSCTCLGINLAIEDIDSLNRSCLRLADPDRAIAYFSTILSHSLRFLHTILFEGLHEDFLLLTDIISCGIWAYEPRCLLRLRKWALLRAIDFLGSGVLPRRLRCLLFASSGG